MYFLKTIIDVVHKKGPAVLRAEDRMVAAGENYIAATPVRIV